MPGDHRRRRGSAWSGSPALALAALAPVVVINDKTFGRLSPMDVPLFLR